MTMISLHSAGLGLMALSTSCRTATPPAVPKAADAAWFSSLKRWHAERNDEIGGPDGWLTLVTRTWLPEGAAKVGSDPSSDVVLPVDRAPPLAGKVLREGAHLRFVTADGVDVSVDGTPKKEIDLVDDHDGHPTVWALGSLTFRVAIARDVEVRGERSLLQP